MKVAEPPVIVPFETPNAPTSGLLLAVTMSAPTAKPRETPTPVLETAVVTAALVVNVAALPLFACTCAQSPRDERMIGLTGATDFVKAPGARSPRPREFAGVAAGAVPIAATEMAPAPGAVSDV